jgi:hypothetical protein
MPYAHGSGIDEAISVVVPLILVVVLLRIGAKKAPPEDEPGPDERQDQQDT